MYAMLIHVDTAEDMALIVQACKGTAKLIKSELIQSRSRAGSRVVPAQKKPIFRKPRVGGRTGADLIRHIFSDGKLHSSEDLRTQFTREGFAPNSYSPLVSKLKAGSEIRQTDEGLWIKTGKLKSTNSIGAAE